MASAMRSKEDKLRDTLTQIVGGESRLLKRPEELYEAIAKGLDDIENFRNARDQLELLAWTLRADFIAFKADTDEEKEFWDDLFYDAGTFFVELSSQYDDKDYVADLIHDLAVRHVGGEGRSVVFLSIGEILPRERAQALLKELTDKVTEIDQGNREDILDAICDMADSIKDAAAFAKAALLKDPDKSNATLIDIANAHFMEGDLELAKQWLGDVRNPGSEDEEAYLDLQAAIADREGRKSDCIKIARTLYETFPKIANLGRLAAFMPDSEADWLLEEHEKFRNGNTANLEFMQLLAAMKRYGQLAGYVERYEKDLTTLDADELTALADALEKDGQKELADHIRDWTVEEPEDAQAFDDRD